MSTWKNLEVPEIDEIAGEIESGNTPDEKMKIAARLKCGVDAYCTSYKDAFRDIALAENSNEIAKDMADRGVNIVESRVTRMARTSKDYKAAATAYNKARKALSFLIVYIEGVKMEHEKKMAREYRKNSEIKAGIFATGR